jgi:hypothetical protein
VFDRSSHQSSLGWQPSLQLELAIMQICNQHNQTGPSNNATAPNVKSTPNEKARRPKEIPEKKSEKTKPSSGKAKAEIIKKSKRPEKDPAPPAEPVNLEADGIQPYWDAIKEKAKLLSAETGALLNSCKSVKVSNGAIVIVFSSSILQSKMENGNNMENARKAILAQTGKEHKIRCEVVGKNSEQSKVDPNLDQDGMIGAALSLGGKMTKEE